MIYADVLCGSGYCVGSLSVKELKEKRMAEGKEDIFLLWIPDILGTEGPQNWGTAHLKEVWNFI